MKVSYKIVQFKITFLFPNLKDLLKRVDMNLPKITNKIILKMKIL